MVRVGLFYGGNALSGANLANDVGSGYRFGYFDGDLTFQLLGYTSETTVSMVKTQNVYYGSNVDWSGSGYYDSKTSDIAVGCYHLQLPQTYATFEEASAAAAQYSDGFPAWIDGRYYVRVGAYLDSTSAQAAQASLGLTGATVAGTSGAGISVVKTGTNTVLFQFDSTSGLYLAVKPGRDDTVKAETYFRGSSYFGAFGGQCAFHGRLSPGRHRPGDEPLLAPGGIESPDGLRPQLRLWKAPGGQAPEPGLRPVQHH